MGILHLQSYGYILLPLVAFVAGTIDSIADGGGLLTLPALLITGLDPVSALGTNKLQSALSEIAATLRFVLCKEISYQHLGYGVLFTAIGSSAGTILLQFIPPQHLKILIPILLVLVLVYYLMPKKGLIQQEEEITAMSHLVFFLYLD